MFDGGLLDPISKKDQTDLVQNLVLVSSNDYSLLATMLMLLSTGDVQNSRVVFASKVGILVIFVGYLHFTAVA